MKMTLSDEWLESCAFLEEMILHSQEVDDS